VFVFTTIGPGPSSSLLVDVWRSQYRREFLPQVEDDIILKVVDVLLIQVNNWGIHPLRETTVDKGPD
jgi:hypothetical protein